MIHLTIDNKKIELGEDRTILEACRENGIYIPTLCYHPALEPYGACRLCVVEISKDEKPSRLVASCTYPCEEGLHVWTNSESVRQNRRVVAELLLASSYDSPEILALASELGVKEIRYKMPEANTCVICGLCVRACDEIVGVSAISLINRGIDKKVSQPFEITSFTCIGCGTCVVICPTGYIKLKDVFGFHGYHQFTSDFDQYPCRVCGEMMLCSQNDQTLQVNASNVIPINVSIGQQD